MPKIIVAIDTPSVSSAKELVSGLSPKLCRIKVGLELFSVAGPNIVELFQRMGFSVFLDLKIHDIPNTCFNAIRSLSGLGVWMLTVHVSGGKAMLEAAVEASKLGSDKTPYPLIMGVTVLTSLDKSDLNQLGMSSTVNNHVLRLASMASDSNVDGIVCGASEIVPVREKFGPTLKIATPGIRGFNDISSDQKRTSSAQSAIQHGSDYLVIGRPITSARDPGKALELFADSIACGQR